MTLLSNVILIIDKRRRDGDADIAAQCHAQILCGGWRFLGGGCVDRLSVDALATTEAKGRSLRNCLRVVFMKILFANGELAINSAAAMKSRCAGMHP